MSVRRLTRVLQPPPGDRYRPTGQVHRSSPARPCLAPDGTCSQVLRSTRVTRRPARRTNSSQRLWSPLCQPSARPRATTGREGRASRQRARAPASKKVPAVISQPRRDTTSTTRSRHDLGTISARSRHDLAGTTIGSSPSASQSRSRSTSAQRVVPVGKVPAVIGQPRRDAK